MNGQPIDAWFRRNPVVFSYPLRTSQSVKMDAVASRPEPVVRPAFKNCGQFETKLENLSREAGSCGSQSLRTKTNRPDSHRAGVQFQSSIV
jgi:hypothetical protein